MKKMTLIKGTLIGAFCIVLGVLYFFIKNIDQSVTEKDNISNQSYMQEKEEKKGIKGALNWLNKIRANQITGVVDYKDVHRAISEIRHSARANKQVVAPLSWVELGPDNVGGRTRTLLVDRSNSNLIFAGGVGGGLWKSTTGGSSWTRIFSIDSFIAVSCIAQASNGDIYVGTGENFLVQNGTGGSGVIGNGIYKSTDGGNTFYHLSSTEVTVGNEEDNERWANIFRIAIDPSNFNRVYAATQKGLLVSDNAGSTWVAAGTFVPFESNMFYDVKVALSGFVYASTTVPAGLTQTWYYRSINGDPGTFQLMSGTGGFPAPDSIDRIEFAISPSHPFYIYSVVIDQNKSCLDVILQSIDGGANWTTIGSGGSTTFKPFSTGSGADCQGFYDIAIAVAPDNPEKIFVGGVNIYSWSNTRGWEKIAISSLPKTSPYYMHVDHHVIAFDPFNPDVMYFGNDGGVFKSMDQGKTFVHIVKNYNILQCYSIAASPDGAVMCGTQDNSTPYIDYKGNTCQSAKVLYSGDGGYVDFSTINKNVLFVSSQQGNIRRSNNLGESFSPFLGCENGLDFIGISGMPKQDACGNPTCDGDGQVDIADDIFVTTFRLWEEIGDTIIDTLITGKVLNPDTNVLIYDTTITQIVDPNMFFFATKLGIWMTKGALDFSTSKPKWFEISSKNEWIESMEYTANGDVVFFGTDFGNLYRVSGLRDANYGYKENCVVVPINTGLTCTDTIYTANCSFIPDSVGIATDLIRTWGGIRAVTGIGIDPNDSNHVVITLGNYGNVNYVYSSNNALAPSPTFTLIQNNLPAMPVFDAVIDAKNSNKYYVATEYGIYASDNAGASWDYVGPERVATFMIRQYPHPTEADSFVLYIGTHGRGMFAAGFESPAICPTTGVDDIDPASGVKSLLVYPNPMKDKGYLSVNLTRSGDIKMWIYDIKGRLMSKGELNKQTPGKHLIQINTASYPSGTYFVRTNVNGVSYLNKIVVIN